MNVKWRRVNEYFSKSDVGYQVSLSYLRGDPGYSAWAPTTPSVELETGRKFELLGCRANPKAAAELCEAHYARATAANDSGGGNG